MQPHLSLPFGSPCFIMRTLLTKIRSAFERAFLAITFAEAGEFDTAVEMLNQESTDVTP